MRRLLVPAVAASALLTPACVPDAGSEARPDQTPPSAKESLPPDALELEDPQDVVEPGHEGGGDAPADESSGAYDG